MRKVGLVRRVVLFYRQFLEVVIDDAIWFIVILTFVISLCIIIISIEKQNISVIDGIKKIYRIKPINLISVMSSIGSL